LAYAPQQAGSPPLAPELEARVQTLGKQLRCAVCQGVAIADSPAQMARAQLDRVRELVAEGKTDDEVREYFVARYGEWVLLEPPAHGINWLVWLAPLALLLFGGVMVLAQLKAPPRKPPAAPPVSSDPYRDAVRTEVER
jgi:cytochrome c-type biogenesis protein CcmH